MPIMKERILSLLPLLLLLFISARTGYAQTAQPPSYAPPLNELGVFADLPLANGSVKGTTSDRHFFLFGLSYSRRLVHSRVCDVRWIAEIMPVELLGEPFIKGTHIQTLTSLPPFTRTRFTYGVGTNPLGVEVIFRPKKSWQPFTGAHAGMSYFTQNVLASRAAQFNFLVDGRAGVRFPLRGAKALSVAYMFQHMSNGYTALENPGVDLHMVHIGFTLPFRFKRSSR
jgi:hypothetical protein